MRKHLAGEMPGGAGQLSLSMTIDATTDAMAARAFVLEALRPVIADDDRRYAIGTVVHELLENVLKYSDWHAPGRARATLCVAASPTSIEVRTINPVDPEGDDVACVLDTVRWMAMQKSPLVAHHHKMLESAEHSRRTGRSRLGLTRIGYEGECVLEAAVDAASRTLRVTATSRIA